MHSLLAILATQLMTPTCLLQQQEYVTDKMSYLIQKFRYLKSIQPHLLNNQNKNVVVLLVSREV